MFLICELCGFSSALKMSWSPFWNPYSYSLKNIQHRSYEITAHASLSCMVSIVTCSLLTVRLCPFLSSHTSPAATGLPLFATFLSAAFSHPSQLHADLTRLASVCISGPPASYTWLMHCSAQAHPLTAGFASLAHSTKPIPVFCCPLCSERPPTNIHTPPYYAAPDHFSRRAS